MSSDGIIEESFEEEASAHLELTSKDDSIEVETKTSKLNVFNWSMYDLANTIYSMVIVSLIIKQYCYIIFQVEHGAPYHVASLLTSIAFMLMQIIVAIGMPIMGAISDNAGKRKPFVISLTGIILLATSLIGFYKNILYVLVFYVIANVAYQWSLAFYDAMLPFIAAPKDAGKVGGFGVAFGYFGTIISLPVMLLLGNFWGDPVSKRELIPDIFEYTELTYGYTGKWFTFAITAGMFLLFAIPFIFVKERVKKGKQPPLGTQIRGAFRQVGSTFKDIRGNKEMFKFVIGYFLVVDVANIIVAYMMLLITDGLLMEGSFGIIFIIISTVSAVIFTYFVGMFADKFGSKKAFFLVGGLWGTAIILGIISITVFASRSNPIAPGFNFPFILVLLMGILSGPALGGTWVAQRSMIVELAPKEKFGEYFGFSKLSGKVSSVVGEGIWGLVMFIFEPLIAFRAYAIEIAVMGIIMAIGLFIISRVKTTGSIIEEAALLEQKADTTEPTK